MDQDQTNQDSPLESGAENELKKLRKNYNQITSELNAIKASVEKRKSETTTLKILFYTALAVLLFGFIYTNQTLQRAQHNNLQANITALKSTVDQNLLSLEKKLHREILESKDKDPHHRLNKSIHSMNQALDKLPYENKGIDKLVKKVKRDSEELISLLRSEQRDSVPEAIP